MPVFSTISRIDTPSLRKCSAKRSLSGSTTLGRPTRLPFAVATALAWAARSRADRPGLERCIDYLRDHDELIVASIDRLARSLVDLRGISDLVFPREIILWAVRWYCRYKVSYQDFVGEMVGRGVPVEQRAIYR